MGLTPLFELFAGPLSFRLANLCAAHRVELFQRKIQSTVAKADRSEPYRKVTKGAVGLVIGFSEVPKKLAPVVYEGGNIYHTLCTAI